MICSSLIWISGDWFEVFISYVDILSIPVKSAFLNDLIISYSVVGSRLKDLLERLSRKILKILFVKLAPTAEKELLFLMINDFLV